MKQIIKLVAVFGVAISAQSALLQNGDMESATYGDATQNNMFWGFEDQGWITKSPNVWSLTANSGALTLVSNTDVTSQAATNASKYAIAQVNSITTETGSDLTLSFDWTAAAGATGAALDLNYQLVGWNSLNGTINTEDRWFSGLNFRSTQVRSPQGASKIDLLTGTVLAGGNANASVGVFTGVAGESSSFSVDLDLSSYDSSFDTLEEYEYIGVKFYLGTADIDGGSALAGGSMLDNVQLTAQVPEPSVVGMVGVSALLLYGIRRRKHLVFDNDA